MKVQFMNQGLRTLPIQKDWVPSEVLEFNIFNNAFTSVPKCIFQMENLKNLNISANQITEIPAEIGSLIRLETVDFGHNSIEKLPDAFFQLVNLKDYVYLHNNHFETFPDLFDRSTGFRL